MMIVMLMLIVTTEAVVVKQGKLNESEIFEVSRTEDVMVSYSVPDGDAAEVLWTVGVEVMGMENLNSPVQFLIRQADQVKSFDLPHSYSDRGRHTPLKIGRRVTTICPFHEKNSTNPTIWMSTYSSEKIKVNVTVVPRHISCLLYTSPSPRDS